MRKIRQVRMKVSIELEKSVRLNPSSTGLFEVGVLESCRSFHGNPSKLDNGNEPRIRLLATVSPMYRSDRYSYHTGKRATAEHESQRLCYLTGVGSCLP